MVAAFFDKGWVVFPVEPAVERWAKQALNSAKVAVQASENKHLHQCGGTWFVGLDALPNDATGRVADSGPLRGAAVDFATQNCGGWPALHRGQLSVIYPGYPRAREGEGDAGFRYRLNRDAAHVDGIIGLGTPKRRFVREPHAFVLGIPLTQAHPDAAPLVVWEGSHRIIQTAMQKVFEGHGTDTLSDIDVTSIYQAARREAFNSCRRVPVHGPPGSAYLVHRLALHGVAPWAPHVPADPGGRMVAYFRPELAGGVAAWAAAR
ncbi:hypothetical protein KX928_11665 [Roseobacter sp. YSTF-M11]|uniref:Uncharacterized protein n=1 Tax=Roseobacter insulae TaxID=2859783 RepID=A0A9X1FVE5_9RHOB|nr:hypothetical protein [Roseobacter insulae]MBW4708441.1 hypothetical protein [Roseobacter insulae]